MVVEASAPAEASAVAFAESSAEAIAAGTEEKWGLGVLDSPEIVLAVVPP